MTTYQKYITIEDPNNVVLSGLPFNTGQRVKVVLVAENSQLPANSQTLQTLFKATQTLPQAQATSVDEIAAEITVYRSGQ